MRSFLDTVAQDLLLKVPAKEFKDTAVVMPTRRAGLFFSERLALQHKGVMLSPVYLSLQDIAEDLTGLRSEDPIELSCLLYKVYHDVRASHGQDPADIESIDEFLPWAELMLKDFSEVDHYMVRAHDLFTTIKENHQMDSLDYLSQEQIELLEGFFEDFSKERMTELKDKFLRTWNFLEEIYLEFRKVLLERGKGYGGMILRKAAEEDLSGRLPFRHYIVVGFGALTSAEKTLLGNLRKEADCHFYWDIDPELLKSNHEAAYFIRENIKVLGSALEMQEQDSRKPQITIITAPGNLIQGRYVGQWFNERRSQDNHERDYAVVLPDESLLMNVLHSLPTSLQEANITMGFPMSQTLAYGLLDQVLRLQESGFRDEGRTAMLSSLMPILRHPLVARFLGKSEQEWTESVMNRQQEVVMTQDLDLETDGVLRHVLLMETTADGLLEKLTRILDRTAIGVKRLLREHPGKDSDLNLESCWRCRQVLDHLRRLQDSGVLEVDLKTMTRLLRRLLVAQSVPFHGEPVRGMQIMGVLETRSLDFEHVLILSMNEDFMPKGASQKPSYIPFTLRQAFRLPTLREQSALYAYTFQRLLRRSKDVTLVYNTAQGGVRSPEVSRYVLQLVSSGKYDIRRFSLSLESNPRVLQRFSIPKTAEMQESLLSRFSYPVKDKTEKGRYLSPSALNCYMDCKLKFFFKYIARIKPQDKDVMEMDPATYGTIFHKAAENLYTYLTTADKFIRRSDLDRIDEVLLTKCVDEALLTEFFQSEPGSALSLTGTQLIYRQVLIRQLRHVAEMDKRNAMIQITGLEKVVVDEFPVKVAGLTHGIRIGGSIDHEDVVDGVLRIVDYKTGGKEHGTKAVFDMFDRSTEKRSYRDFQVFLYSLIEQRLGYQGPIMPQVLYLRKVGKDYEPGVSIAGDRVQDSRIHACEFGGRLTDLLEEIFNPGDVYEPTEISHFCEYCDYASICSLRKASGGNDTQEDANS